VNATHVGAADMDSGSCRFIGSERGSFEGDWYQRAGVIVEEAPSWNKNEQAERECTDRTLTIFGADHCTQKLGIMGKGGEGCASVG